MLYVSLLIFVCARRKSDSVLSSGFFTLFFAAGVADVTLMSMYLALLQLPSMGATGLAPQSLIAASTAHYVMFSISTLQVLGHTLIAFNRY
ncbi:hypothetical protein AAVH_35951, partial [Aphelenchoides avenae]